VPGTPHSTGSGPPSSRRFKNSYWDAAIIEAARRSQQLWSHRDTGGLMQNNAPVIYAYSDLDTIIEEESGPRRKADPPGPGDKPPTERPGT